MRLIGVVIHAIADYIFRVMLEGYHKIRKHTVQLSAPGVAAFMSRNKIRFTFTVVMADYPFTVIPEDESTFLAHGTKVFTAVR